MSNKELCRTAPDGSYRVRFPDFTEGPVRYCISQPMPVDYLRSLMRRHLNGDMVLQQKQGGKWINVSGVQS